MKKTSQPKKNDAGASVTPMMAQYLEIKANHPDCLLFFRMGDFYELFFDDAVAASKALGIVLTKRGKHLEQDIPMCGVPVERCDDYLGRLIQAGFRVAVAEQTENPKEAKKRGPKAVVARDVVRLLTPATLVEDHLLDPTQANYLAALVCHIEEQRRVYGLALADVSTGVFEVRELREEFVALEVARFNPSELVYPQSMQAIVANLQLGLNPHALVSVADTYGDVRDAPRRLQEYYGVRTLDGFGARTDAELSAAALLVSYVQRTLKAQGAVLAPPKNSTEQVCLEMDSATRANLEILYTASGQREGALFANVNATLTNGGARLLGARLNTPSTNLQEIHTRLNLVEVFYHAPALMHALRRDLRTFCDVERCLARLKLGKSSPRDLQALASAIECAHGLKDKLQSALGENTNTQALEMGLVGVEKDVAERFFATFGDELPLKSNEGGFVRSGVCVGLDELRLLGKDSRQVILGMQANFAEQTGVRNLKIKQNQFLGYFIEVSLKDGEDIRTGFADAFIHRQTMSDAMRFTTTELMELDEKIQVAFEKSIVRELEIFKEWCEAFLALETSLTHMAHAVAQLDVALSTAFLALERKWCKPLVDESLAFEIEGGRHSVVESALKDMGETFVPNGCLLSPLEGHGESGKIALITGPNMGGKSTFLRQNALFAVMAQAGLYVSAKRAHIGLVDRLFSRVGASDDLSRGRSTFMVEMVETAVILNRATEKSLVILDEIGRGTSTYDGMAIAQAVVEHIHTHNRSRCLFATHFHELTKLAQTFARLFLYHIRVHDHKGHLVFLHEIAPGVAKRSYGIEVAKLAGVPQSVLSRAQVLLSELEHSTKHKHKIDVPPALPLFDTMPQEPNCYEPLAMALEAMNPDDLSPKEALDVLYSLKKLYDDAT